MAIGKFGNGAAATKPAARPTPKPVRRVSRYANAEEKEDRDPMPVPGKYIFRVVACEDNPSPANESISWYKAHLEIVALEGPQAEAKHSVGDIVSVLQQTSGNGAKQGVPRVVSFTRCAAGYDDIAEYKAFNPNGYFEEAQTGLVNEYSEREEFILGRLVFATVTRGNDTKDGSDYYRNYAWEVVPDGEEVAPGVFQEVPKVGAS